MTLIHPHYKIYGDPDAHHLILAGLRMLPDQKLVGTMQTNQSFLAYTLGDTRLNVTLTITQMRALLEVITQAGVAHITKTDEGAGDLVE